MAKKTREEILAEFERQKKATDRHEEYMAKCTYEKKPRALRRYEKFSNMGNDKPKSIKNKKN